VGSALFQELPAPKAVDEVYPKKPEHTKLLTSKAQIPEFFDEHLAGESMGLLAKVFHNSSNTFHGPTWL